MVLTCDKNIDVKLYFGFDIDMLVGSIEEQFQVNARKSLHNILQRCHTLRVWIAWVDVYFELVRVDEVQSGRRASVNLSISPLQRTLTTVLRLGIWQ